MSKPYLSIIVPIYNVESYLEKCICSVIAQSYENLEIILVDDGATDSSGVICDKYAEIDSRIRVLHTCNGGVSEARNNGLKIAKGEYIAFVDSDDYLLDNNIYSECIEILEDNSDLDCVQFSYSCVNSANQMIGIHHSSYIDYYGSREFFEAFENILGDGCAVIKALVWNKVYRRSAIMAGSPLYFKANVKFEDAIFTSDLFLRIERMKLISTVGYAYVQNPQSIMGQSITIEKATDAINSNLHVLNNACKANISQSILSNYLCKIFYELCCLDKLYGYVFDNEVYMTVDAFAKQLLMPKGLKNIALYCMIRIFGSRRAQNLWSLCSSRLRRAR